jgi:hypothetical protein
MPLTDPERRFLDDYLIETVQLEQAHGFCWQQLRPLSISGSEIGLMCAVREREWAACYRTPSPGSNSYLDLPIPETATPCPWPDKTTLVDRFRAVTFLCEENILISRDFYQGGDGLPDYYINEPPRFDDIPSIADWTEFLPTQGWKYRATFPKGIQRGEVSESFCQFPFSIWDPVEQSPYAVECHYLMLILTPPEPIRVWSVTRSDVLLYAGNGNDYRLIFPTPFNP